jgi:hypothetical protein
MAGVRLRATGLVTLVMLGMLTGGACIKKPPATRQYYDQHIQPVFDGFCVGNTSPCHRIDPASGTALGNLDLSSFEGVQRRRDVLRSYGVYPQPLLLLKAVPDGFIPITYRDKQLPSEIRHAGGKTLSATSDAFYELKRWLDNGATRTGQSPATAKGVGAGGCTPGAGVPTATVDRSSAAYQQFAADIEPLLVSSCAYSNCHGSEQADFRLSCADSELARDANFARAAAFIVAAPGSVEGSELLLRPLAPRAGGLSHTGGSFFTNREDLTWQSLKAWAQLVQQAPPTRPARSIGESFFVSDVMPVLLRRGCALEGCHSPNGFNDYRLRPGSVGFLSEVALTRNYETTLLEFMALDTPDVRQSRLVKKNLVPASGGITHRGGALLEGPGPVDGTCPSPYDAASTSAFCTIAEWHRLERIDRADTVLPLEPGQSVPLAYVARPPDPDGPLEFDTFRGGADLKLGQAVLGARGHVERVDNVRSALGTCGELAAAGGNVDVRGPEWSYDGKRLIFAARVGPAGGLDLWQLEPASGNCQRLTSSGGTSEKGVRVHNFDPVFAPDDSVVFASTRRGLVTPKRFLPNADLYRVGPGGDFTRAEPMTVLSGSELAPAFMQNGQLSFTAEKASAEFYQLSGRRINWDLTDYHPLLAQRARSDDTFGKLDAPSVGYQQATEIREGLDRNFLLIVAGTDAKGGGGALGVFNRSIGPFEQDRAEVTFVRSFHMVDPRATGRDGTVGVYRSPSSLLDGEILASYAAEPTNPARDVPRYDLVAVSEGGARRVLVPGGAQSLVEATLGYQRSNRHLFRNTAQLVFGGHAQGEGEANVHFPDLPMLATLLNANLRRGRNVAAFDDARFLAVYEAGAPPSATPDPSLIVGSERVYTQRTLLGVAPLEVDGSLRVSLPSRRPLILELQNAARQPLFTMREEHQLGPGETISPGVPRQLFNGVCGGCHGSRSGAEPDIAVTADALTGATMSLSRGLPPKALQ